MSILPKLLFLGATDSGKTSIIKESYYISDNLWNNTCYKYSIEQERYNNEDVCNSVNPTIGIDYKTKKINIIPKGVLRFSIWDTAGQERYKSIVSMYYKDTDILVLIFDMSNKKSLDELYFWYNEFINLSYSKNLFNLPIIIVGNKIDINNFDNNYDNNFNNNYVTKQLIDIFIKTIIKKTPNYKLVFCSIHEPKTIINLFEIIIDNFLLLKKDKLNIEKENFNNEINDLINDNDLINGYNNYSCCILL